MYNMRMVVLGALLCLVTGQIFADNLTDNELQVLANGVEAGMMYESKEVMKVTKTFYKLYKNNEFKGYLLGSFHAYFNPLDYENFQIKLAEHFKEVESLYFEVEFPHYITLGLGIERVLLELSSKPNS